MQLRTISLNDIITEIPDDLWQSYDEQRAIENSTTVLNDTSLLILESKHFSKPIKNDIFKNSSQKYKNSPSTLELSACILVKDENHNLPEWLAYHYTMARLRNLIVCLDPHAISSPRPILNLWQKNSSMKIDIWEEDFFFRPKRVYNISIPMELVYKHRARQNACYGQCLKYLKQNNKTWTFLIDADEFLTFNPPSIEDNPAFSLISQPNSNPRYEFLEEKLDDEYIPTEKKLMESRCRVPTEVNSITIADFIEKEKNEVPWISRHCTVFPRLQFGTTEETNQNVLRNGVPEEFEAKNFSTLRFFSHAKKGSSDNHHGKPIVDVSRQENFDIRNPHSLDGACGYINGKHLTASLRVNHYTPVKELFYSKFDPRRDEKMFQSRSQVNYAKSYEIQGWLNNFIHLLGVENAKILLNSDHLDLRKKIKGSNQGSPILEKYSTVDNSEKTTNETVISTLNSLSKVKSNQNTKMKSSKEAYSQKDSIDLQNGHDTNNIPKTKGNLTLSACLMIKDENHNLPEWLSYHYTMAKLRFLVVCLDPTAYSSPRPILKLWRKKSNMTIDIWDEKKFFKPRRIYNVSDPMEQVHKHRARQNSCYAKCMRYLKEKHQTWTFFIDADEYLTFNAPSVEDNRAYEKVKSSDSNYRVEFNENKVRNRYSPIEKDLMKSRCRVPTAVTNVTIADFIEDEKENDPWQSQICFVLPRLQFGTTEEANLTLLHHRMPSEFETEKFLTLRFFSHAKKGSFDNRYGKPMVDVSRNNDYSVRNVHSFNKGCGDALGKHLTSSLRVNHYTPLREMFYAKIDPRRNEKMYKSRAEVNAAKSYEIQGWLEHFVRLVGGENSKLLLKDYRKPTFSRQAIDSEGTLLYNSKTSKEMKENSQAENLQKTSKTKSSLKINSLSTSSISNQSEEKRTNESLAYLSGQGDSVSSLSACLLVKDENHILPEWLAYHYAIANLRYLVVCVDGNSDTSPNQILTLWQNFTDINIDIWSDNSYFNPIRTFNHSHRQDIIKEHRLRQRTCYEKCLIHLKKLKKTWTFFIDADEFLTFNPVTSGDHPSYVRFNGTYEFDKSKLVMNKKDISLNEMHLMAKRTKVPSLMNGLTIANYIAQNRNQIPFNTSSCIVLPRLQFGSKEEHDKKLLMKGHLTGFHVQNFTTLRFFNHARKGGPANRYGKPIVDVSRNKINSVRNPHSFHKHCGNSFPNHLTSLLRVNHYLPPYDVFFSKVDVRRNDKMYNDRNKKTDYKTFEMQGWLQKFVESTGVGKAKTLLENAGAYLVSRPPR